MLRRMIPLLITAVFLAAPLAAQDNGGGGGTESFFSEDEESGGAPGSGSGASASVGGKVELELRAFPDFDNFDDFAESPVTAVPRVNTELTFEGSQSEIVADLEYSSRQRPLDNPEELINEAYMQLFYDNLDVEAGYIKTTWGTGDEVHVVDVLNPTDFTDSVNGEYSERKIAEKMVKLNVYTGMNGLLELAYVPVLSQDRYALEGRWKPYRLEAMEEQLDAELEEAVLAGTLTSSEASTLADQIAADAQTAHLPTELSDGQYGLRYSNSFGGVDLGAVYYFGFDRSPVVEIPESDPEDYTIHFDRLNLFGLEFATAVAGFNLRAEAAYNMTEDFDGDDPYVHNHSVAYMGGFDRDLPLSNLNVNIQGRGEYILDNDEVSDNGPRDADYDPGDNEHYWNNTLIASIKDDYKNETIKPSVDFVLTAETQDFLLRPGVEFVLANDSTLNVRGSVFEGEEDTEFGQFDGNDHLEVSFEYAF